MKRALAQYCVRQPRTGIRRLLSHLPVPEDPRKIAFRPHTTAAWARFKISARVFDSYCRFSVVRDPFDRAVSNYHFVQQRPEHHSHVHVQHLCFDQYLDFLKWRRWSRDPTQRARLVDARGRLRCDPILRFESLNADFAALCQRLQLPDIPQLPQRNTSRHEPFHRFYERRETRDKLVDLFAADFETFGYETAV